MTQKQLSFTDLAISEKDIFEQMGYRATSPDEATHSETIALIEEIRLWLRARFCYFVSSELPPFTLGAVISRQLHGSEAYAFFICTAGTEYESFQKRLSEKGDMVRMYIADSLGSVIAERCADQMELHLQQSIDKLGWHHTNRFSPGYCGWHVSQQQLLFPLFEGHTCGVSLNDSSLMVPIKSVSGIIGLGHKVQHLDYTCGLCQFEKCYKKDTLTVPASGGSIPRCPPTT